MFVLTIQEKSLDKNRSYFTHKATISLDAYCQFSFQDFAFATRNLPVNTQFPKEPVAPWIESATIPVKQLPDLSEYPFDTTLRTTLNIKGKTEIWIETLRWGMNVYPREAISVWYRYIVDDNMWTNFDPNSVLQPLKNPTGQLFKTTLDQVFHLENGETWVSYWSVFKMPEQIVYTLGRLNQISGRFEPMKDISAYEKVSAATSGQFWLYLPQNGFYLFDSRSGQTVLQINLSDRSIKSYSVGSDGSLYYVTLKKTEPVFELSGYAIYYYSRKSAIETMIDIPAYALKWPTFLSLFILRNGHMYADASGFRNTLGLWLPLGNQSLTFPEIWNKNNLEQEREYRYLPQAVLESSDGRIWFRSTRDLSLISGIAWYNPQTTQGCMVTSEEGNIFEDNQNRIWIAVNGKLYRLNIMP